MEELATIAGSALVSGIISALIGVAVRISIGKALDDAKSEAELRHKRRIETETLHRAWHHRAGRVIYHLALNAQGRDTNGDIPAAYAQLDEIERQQKELNLRTLAEMQED